MAKSPLDDPSFPSARMYDDARETAQRLQANFQQEPTPLPESSKRKLDEAQENIARLRKQVESLMIERQSKEWQAKQANEPASPPPPQPKKKSIHNSEMLEFVSQYIPDPKDIHGWPDEAKIIIYHLSGILKGIVIGTHVSGEQIATYLKDLKDEPS